MPRHNPTDITRARALRQANVPAERRLWRELRGRRFAEYKFRRQHPVPPYTVDFCCLALRLVIELDGESHLSDRLRDSTRDAFLARQGWQVPRFWNTHVYDEKESVLEAIWQACEVRKARNLPSPPGERGRG
jgi:very-short-patch-repair endonuclease